MWCIGMNTLDWVPRHARECIDISLELSSHCKLYLLQCYTHRNLGWKINVYDEYPAEIRQETGCPGDKLPRLITTGEAVAICMAVLLALVIIAQAMIKYYYWRGEKKLNEEEVQSDIGLVEKRSYSN